MLDAAAVDDALASEHEALLQFLYLCPYGLAHFGRDGTILMLNPAFACLTMPLLPRGAPLANLVEVLGERLPELRSLLQDQRPRGMICDGARIHLGAPEPGRDPSVLALTVVRMDADRHMAVLSDVTRQVADERRLQESEAWFAAVVQGADDYAVLGLTADGSVGSWNVSGERMFGYPAEMAVGRPASAMVGSGDDAATFDARLREAGRDGWQRDEGWRTRADGSRFWGTCMVSPLGVQADAPHAPDRYLMVVRDVTERRKSAHELRRALSADHLTGVLNRRCFLERASREIGRPRLTAIADVLKGIAREDHLVGRLGGEEFAVFMPASEPAEAAVIAEALRAGIAALRLTADGRALQVTASIGVSAGDERADLKRLIGEADAALYVAKRSGRDRVSLAGAILEPASGG